MVSNKLKPDLYIGLIFAFITYLSFKCQIEGTCSFTYDFVTGYHPINSYIVEYFRHGLWPAWIAQQSSGYPIYMHVQNDMYNPVLWFFGLADIPYTLHAANIVQVLHIYVGAIGAYALARSHSIGRLPSFFAGLAYLSMGGFFDGSQHLDIVRGYVFLPWCLMSLRITGHLDGRSLVLRSIPFAAYLLTAYPGQIIAVAYVFPVYVLMQFYGLSWNDKRTSFFNLMMIGTVFIVATGLALPKYLPFAMDFTQEISRAGKLTSINRAIFEPVHFFSFVLDTSNGNWPSDVTIRSYYIGILVLLLFFLSSWKILLKFRIYIVTLVFSLILAANLPILLFGKYAQIFGLSRFNVTDYKGFITLSIIIIAAAELDSMLSREIKLSNKRILLVFLALFAYVCAGVWFTGATIRYDVVVTLFTLASASIVIYLIARKNCDDKGGGIGSISLTVWLASLLLLLLVVNAMAVHGISPLWRDHEIIRRAPGYLKFNVFNDAPPSGKIFETINRRPVRVDIGHLRHFTSRGFYTGEFIVKGYDASKNMNTYDFLGPKNSFTVDKKDPLIHFFMLPGCALILGKNSTTSDVLSYIKKISKDKISLTCENSDIQQISYSSNEVVYSVNVKKDVTMVENEINWNGWSGTIEGSGTVTKLEPIVDFTPYRSWRLPKGHYVLRLSFHNPYLSFSIIIAVAVIASGLFLLGLILYLKKSAPFELL